MYRGLMITRWLAPADDLPQGGQSQTGQGSGDQPQGVTLDQVNEIVNKAISARNKQVDAKLEKSFTDFSTAFASKLDEKFAALKPAEPETPPQKPATETAEYKALKRKLDELETNAAKDRQEKDAANARAQAQSLRQKVQDGLATGGIGGKSLQYALGVLLDSEKRVRFDEDGERVLFKGDDGDELPLTDGLKAWLKSDDAKVFPPRGTNGSGQRPGGSPPNSTGTPPKPGQLGQAIASVLFGPNSSTLAEE